MTPSRVSSRTRGRPATGPGLRIGTSGYQYPHWRGAFYPEALPVSRWFDYYADRFDTVEINNTFYRLPEAGVFDAWCERAPPGFLYALKFSRYGSHLKRLLEPRKSLSRFVIRARRLRRHLGPILVQLPPRWRADPGRLDRFLRAAPRHLRWAIEFRDPSWLAEPVYRVLRAHRAALCVHDLIPEHPRLVTAPWVYLRFHGAGLAGGYTARALAAIAHEVREHRSAGRDVYAYFNNDAGGWAVRNAATLRELCA